MRLAQILGRLQGRTAKLIFVSERGQETVRTFDELHRDTVRLAERLKQIGVTPGCRVGILAPSSYTWMLWDLATLRLDAVSVALPQERCAGSIAPSIDRYALDLLAVDREWVSSDVLAREDVLDIGALGAANGKRAVARARTGHAPGTHSLVFSSGTTGKTKGLIISAPGTERLLDLYEAAFGVRDGDRFLTFLPFANYQQRMAYYFCLYHAIDFVYVPYPQLFPGLKKHRPTYVIAPPVFYESLHALAQATINPKSGAEQAASSTADRLSALLGGNIRYLVTGMAPIRRQTLDFFWHHGIPLYEAFGITEAGMVAWNKPGCVKVGTVGTPAEPGSVSLTAEGEVIVTRDALLSLGYFEAAEEDARATFIAPNSVATGDIAAFDDTGFLTIIGRKKDAIITKAGEKFHPEPIESLIQRDPRVKVAVVLGGDGIPGITAIVSLQNSGDAAVTSELRRAISDINEHLPVCQRVKQIVFTPQDFSIENGLRTKNMKLNRRAIHQAFLENRLRNVDHIHETAV